MKKFPSKETFLKIFKAMEKAMGQDVRIFFKIREDKPLALENVDYFKQFTIRPLVRNAEDPDDNDYAPLEATHKVDTSQRYYGIGYERGEWPLIALVLTYLLTNSYIEIVWYGSDAHDAEMMEPFTKQDLMKITEHYLEVQHKPYYHCSSHAVLLRSISCNS